MKKWLFVLGAVALLCTGWYFARQQRVQMGFNKPEFGKIDRGDIQVPITAPALIEPFQRYEIKSEASGEVIEILVAEGDFVRANDVLIKLDPEDEQRNFDRFEEDHKTAELQLENMKLRVKDAEETIKINEARLERLKADEPRVKAEFQQVEDDKNKPVESRIYSTLDGLTRKSFYDANLADQNSALATIEQSKNALEQARITVKQQEGAVLKAKKNFEDAKKRLDETTIRAPQDGIVTDVAVSLGAKIQSGVSSMTGGTVLGLMADVSMLKAVARVDEADYGKIVNISPVDALPEMPGRDDALKLDAEMLKERTGKVKLTVDAFPDEVFEGTIIRVEPQGRVNAGSSVVQFDVHIEVTDKDRYKLPLGAQSQVEFKVESVQNALRVPTDAVKSNVGQVGVWIPTPPPPGEKLRGKKFVACKFGISDGEFTEVVETLDAGAPELKAGMEVYTKLPPDRDD